jgi:hypothetical protein
MALTDLSRFAEAEQELVGAERALEAAQGVPQSVRRKCFDALVALYAAWEQVEPGRGAAAAPWKAKLEALPAPGGRR